MAEEYTPPRRFPGIRKEVSLFFSAALIGIICVTLFVSYKQGAFVRHTPIYFYVSDAFGITKGMSVRLFGLPIGTVKSMEVSGLGVKVEISIASNYVQHIPKGSTVRLLREGYIGAASIQITPNADPTKAATPISSGETLEFVRSRGVAELIDDIKNQITPVLKELSKAVTELNQPDSDVRMAAAAARKLFEELPSTNIDARRMLQNTDHLVLNADRAVRDVGREASAALASATRIGAQTEQQLPQLSAKLTSTLESVSRAATEVRDATRKNSDALHEALLQGPALARQGEDLMRDTQEVVEATRNIWPISSALPTPGMRTLPVDSFESATVQR